MISEHIHENARRLFYNGGACFIPVCEKCKRFVKADKKIMVNDFQGLSEKPNAKCSKCGRTKMIFEGFF
jgi:hypothetical protein